MTPYFAWSAVCLADNQGDARVCLDHEPCREEEQVNDQRDDQKRTL